MKKLISIENLQMGMFLEAEVVSQVVDNEELYYLAALNAAGGHAKRRAARSTGGIQQLRVR